MPLAANIDPHLCIATSDISLQIISHNIQLGFLVYLEVTDKRQEKGTNGNDREKKNLLISTNNPKRWQKVLQNS